MLITYGIIYIYLSMFLSLIHFVVNSSIIPFYNSIMVRLSKLLNIDLNLFIISIQWSSFRLRFGIFFNLVLTCFFSVIYFYYIFFFNNNFNFIIISNSVINIEICIDWLSVCMLVLVSFISLIVHTYSLWYMELDFYLDKFLVYLSCFTGSMLVLVLGGNLLCNFIGWELVGVFSFLLISFWDSRKEALRAACKALFLNKIGDIFFLVGIVFFFLLTKSFNIENVNFIVGNFFYFFGFYFRVVDFILLCFFIAAAAKSAQLGLHMWLIDAMEGPTPVSALIHAATMVTAGVFLLIRCNILFSYCSTEILTFISFWGILTAFIGGLLAIFQYDIKKIIAYSTMSQLGYMIAVVPFDSTVALFHLINHGWFKALLFLSSGVVIHFCNNEQDIRRLKPQLFKMLPLTFLTFCLCSLLMIALPLTSGFFSKDFIYELLSYNKIYIYYFNLLIFTGFFTIIYSVRLVFFVFFKISYVKVNFIFSDNKFIVLFVYIPLFFLMCFSGYFFIILLKTSLFYNINYNLTKINLIVLFIFIIYFFFLKDLFFLYYIKKNKIYIYIYTFLTTRLLLDVFFNKAFYYMFVYMCWFFYSIFEMGWIYYCMGPSLVFFFRYISIFFKVFENFDSIRVIIFGFIFIILFIL